MSRRKMLSTTGAVLGLSATGLLVGEQITVAEPEAKTTTSTLSTTAIGKRSDKEPFGYCLNTSTIRGQKLSLVQEIEIAAKAGYHAIEPWLSEIETHDKNGGTTGDLKKLLADSGISVESVIAFPEWVVDDDAKRAKALEQFKRDSDLIQQIGGKRIACPPKGATDVAGMSLQKIAERYRALLEIGDKTGVVPELEVWGFSKTLGRLSEAAAVVVECAHPQACILPDVFHLYKGGSDLNGIRMLSGDVIHVIHLNDYPSQPARDKIGDAERIYPGDGVAPLKNLFRHFKAIGFTGFLSVELFNRDYWNQDALTVAKTAIEKTRIAVLSAWEDSK